MRTLALLLAVGASAFAASSPYQRKGQEVLLWPGGAPGSEGKDLAGMLGLRAPRRLRSIG
jgi:hypothetical protein